MNAVLNFAVFSLSMAAATVLLYFLARIAGKRCSSRCRYLLWAVLVVRMCLPLTFMPTFLTYQTAAPSAAVKYGETAPTDVRSIGYEAATQNGVRSPADQTASAPAESAGYHEEKTASPNPGVIIPAVYFGVCAVIFIGRLSGYGVTMRKMRSSLRDPDAETLGVYRRIAEETGVRSVPALYVSDFVRSPLLCGLFRRKIVLTEAALAPSVLEGVLRHELTHHKSGDLAMKFVGTLCLSVNFMNPAAYFAVGIMDREMEYSCDERVLSGSDAEKRSEYGLAVLDVIKAERRHKLSAALTTEFARSEKELGKRFDLIMDEKKKKRGAAMIVAALLICTFAGSVFSFRAAKTSGPEKAPVITTEKESETERETTVPDETDEGTEPEDAPAASPTPAARPAKEPKKPVQTDRQTETEPRGEEEPKVRNGTTGSVSQHETETPADAIPETERVTTPDKAPADEKKSVGDSEHAPVTIPVADRSAEPGTAPDSDDGAEPVTVPERENFSVSADTAANAEDETESAPVEGSAPESEKNEEPVPEENERSSAEPEPEAETGRPDQKEDGDAIVWEEYRNTKTYILINPVIVFDPSDRDAAGDPENEKTVIIINENETALP